MKGGVRHHGKESQGRRQEEGGEEAVTASSVRKKGGGRRPLFNFRPAISRLGGVHAESPPLASRLAALLIAHLCPTRLARRRALRSGAALRHRVPIQRGRAINSSPSRPTPARAG